MLDTFSSIIILTAFRPRGVQDPLSRHWPAARREPADECSQEPAHVRAVRAAAHVGGQQAVGRMKEEATKATIAAIPPGYSRREEAHDFTAVSAEF